MRNSGAPTWLQFVAWALCGASAAVMLLAAFALGPLAVLPTGAFAGLAVWLGGGNISAVGAAAGVGSWGFVLAWLNRGGPGEVCSTTRTGTFCQDEWSPWPFLLAGVVFVGAALVLFVSLRRRLGVRRPA